jgi:hypothetical protein
MNDGLFFFGVFFFFFVAWIAGGGPSKPISFAGPYITPVTSSGNAQSGYGTLSGIRGIGTNWGSSSGSGSARSDLFTIQRSVDGLQKQVTDAKLFGDPSPYKGEVTISWGNNVGATDPSQEYITIKAAHDAPQDITISGWSVQSVSNDVTATIPNGQELFSSNNNATAPIILHPGDVAYLITGEPPLTVSFRENECMGYYTKSQNFSPSLSQNCPLAQDEFDKHYAGNTYKDAGCYNLIRTLNQCQVPPDPASLSTFCSAFIDQYLSYQGCVANHRGDPQFWNGGWRIYLGRKVVTKNHSSTSTYGELWKSSHDAIRLLDQNGKTVDLYQY